jgi:hypothetical protein
MFSPLFGNVAIHGKVFLHEARSNRLMLLFPPRCRPSSETTAAKLPFAQRLLLDSGITEIRRNALSSARASLTVFLARFYTGAGLALRLI